jgi:hypothetical protein
LLDQLSELVIQKDQEEVFFAGTVGEDASSIVSVLASLQHLKYKNDGLTTIFLQQLSSWPDSLSTLSPQQTALFIKQLSLLHADDHKIKLECFVELAPALHTILSKAYHTNPKEHNIQQSKPALYAQVPDLNAFSDLWLGIGMLARIKSDS